MRIARFIPISAVALRDIGVPMLPCRSAPVY